jgi:cysteine-rich repeat protein
MRRTRKLTSCIVSLGSGLLLAGCAPDAAERLGETNDAISQSLGRESEPNNTPATANLIGTDTVVRATNFPIGDPDYFAFQGNAGDKVYAATMTSSSVTTTSDTLIQVLQPDGTTVIEEDDDNGTLSSLSSVIAGATLTQSGTHYIRVTPFSTTAPVLGYDLHLRIQQGSPVAEVEPNDAAPNVLPASGWVSGNLSSLTDVDIFSINLNAGDTLFAALDLDPTRDASEWNGQIGIGPFGITNTPLPFSDAGNTGFDAEGGFVTVKNAGTYAVGVNLQGGTVFGDYGLSVAVRPATPLGVNCTTYTSTDAAQPIPTGPGMITSTIVVPGNPRIEDIDISLQLTHASPPDLDIYLTSPAGNTNGIVTDLGSTTFTNWDVAFDDQAAFPAGAYNVYDGLIVQPERDYRLGWLKGENAGGTWTLNVLDDLAANGGTLTGWSMTICEPSPAPTCTGGSALIPVFSSDFEAGDAGFTHSGMQDEWARGLPTAAPITSCNSGTNCWKTDLTGTYNASSTQDLKSAAIDLTTNVAPIQVRWAMKYQMDTAANDRAWVDVQEVGGANPKRIWQHLDGAMTTIVGNPSTTIQESAGWGIHTADLSAYAGKQVELVFHVDSNATTQLAGLAIDDVSVSACSAVVCGDGVIGPGETCDDNNTTSGDGCDSNCTVTACGNGVITVGEVCDDGNATNDDGCDNNCTVTACGNGVPTGEEACDDGNMTEGDGCDSNCTVTACGNGVITAGETCDDANLTDGDGCDNNCTVTGCGNGVMTMGEVCDDGNATEGDGCDSNCTVSACGNGITSPTEVCDDGNLVDGDNCDSNCTPTGCGNGIMTMGEACDDGNPIEGDNCDSNCTVSACGNGIIAPTEVCDDGNLVDGDNCDSNCTVTACGNGIVTMGEVCDDGNATNGDNCDNNCTVTACGNGIVTMGEVCDDGNLTSGDNCDSNCTVTGCGNTIVTMGETCDDGNLVDGDNCDSNCTATGCNNGVVTTGEACDDGNMTSGDACDINCTVPACGNGVQAGAEGCDDGNVIDGDNCDSNCTVTGCGNGVLTGTEVCDDNNMTNGDGCDNNCTVTACGNGVTSDPETCDDGNTTDGDGCDSNCTATACGNNVVTDPEECDDGNTTDGDGCAADCTTEGAGGAGGGGNGGGGAGGKGGEGGVGEGGAGGTKDEPVFVEGGCNCATVGNTESTKSSLFSLVGLFGLLAAKLRRRK